MNAKHLQSIDITIASVIAAEPGISFDVDKHGKVMVGLWFDAATGQEYECAFEATFSHAYARAVQKRADRLASALVEAEVRAEVEARMAKAA